MWVEFAPQFHLHLVKCTVALVPWLISKVKKVLFVYILELLNEEDLQAFFALTKGQRRESQAQKEKKWLACKRNQASQCEQWKVAEEAMEGLPQWKCEWCRCKFTSHKNMKHHQCPLAKGASRGEVGSKGKGKTVAKPKPNKPGPILPPNPSTSKPMHHTTTSTRGAKKKRPRDPSSAHEVAESCGHADMIDRAFHSSFSPSVTTSV
jgi:hypothetical protein